MNKTVYNSFVLIHNIQSWFEIRVLVLKYKLFLTGTIRYSLYFTVEFMTAHRCFYQNPISYSFSFLHWDLHCFTLRFTLFYIEIYIVLHWDLHCLTLRFTLFYIEIYIVLHWDLHCLTLRFTLFYIEIYIVLHWDLHCSTLRFTLFFSYLFQVLLEVVLEFYWLLQSSTNILKSSSKNRVRWVAWALYCFKDHVKLLEIFFDLFYYMKTFSKLIVSSCALYWIFKYVRNETMLCYS